MLPQSLAHGFQAAELAYQIASRRQLLVFPFRREAQESASSPPKQSKHHRPLIA